MFRGEGGGSYSDLCLLSELFFRFKLLNFKMFLVSSFFFFFFFFFVLLFFLLFFFKFFSQLFYWYVRQFEQVFFRYVNLHRNFGGASLKMFVFMGFL